MSAAPRKMLSLVALTAIACLFINVGCVRAECDFGPSVQHFRSVDQMPAPLSESVLGKFKDETAPGIAARDGQFNATDVISDPRIPRRRLLDAGRAGDRCFLWYEHGGRGLHRHMILLEYRIGGPVELAENATALDGDFCAPTKAWLAGASLPHQPIKKSEW